MLEERAQVELYYLQLYLAGVDLLEVEQRRDERHELFAVAAGYVEVVAGLLAEGVVLCDVVERGEGERQRGADVVSRVDEEVDALGFVFLIQTCAVEPPYEVGYRGNDDYVEEPCPHGAVPWVVDMYLHDPLADKLSGAAADAAQMDAVGARSQTVEEDLSVVDGLHGIVLLALDEVLVFYVVLVFQVDALERQGEGVLRVRQLDLALAEHLVDVRAQRACLVGVESGDLDVEKLYRSLETRCQYGVRLYYQGSAGAAEGKQSVVEYGSCPTVELQSSAVREVDGYDLYLRFSRHANHSVVGGYPYSSERVAHYRLHAVRRQTVVDGELAETVQAQVVDVDSAAVGAQPCFGGRGEEHGDNVCVYIGRREFAVGEVVADGSLCVDGVESVSRGYDDPAVGHTGY